MAKPRSGNLGSPDWSLRIPPRRWQRRALERWRPAMRGVVSVVTGGGKTIFAFLCMESFRKKYPAGQIFVLVPTLTLVDQWCVSLQEELGVPADEIACFSSQERMKAARTVNVLVINSARRLLERLQTREPAFLVVDECHRAGSPENAKALKGTFAAALGLSATPKREYDSGFEERVLPALGPLIFDYGYEQAYIDGVVAPFSLVNVQVQLLPHERDEYDRLTGRVARLARRRANENGDVAVDEALRRALQMRAAVSATATMRVPVAAKLVDAHRGARAIVFHERVGNADALASVLKARNHSVTLYHSRIAPNVRRDNLRLFRRGVFDVLVACRALDEGMNVPEAVVAVIASSTASRRQRIQRLGRVLRPARGKKDALVYTLFATKHERARLETEAAELEGVAGVTWSVAERLPDGEGRNGAHSS